MKDDFMRFLELIKTDETLQKKLDEAGRSYTGEQAEEVVFNSVVVPIAKEAGYDITFDDWKQSIQEIDLDEMGQVSGGQKTPAGGLGAVMCSVLGMGLGGAGGSNGGGACLLIGGGWNSTVCAISGNTKEL